MSESTERERPADREVVALDIAAPPDVVWLSLRDPTELTRWFGWDYDGLADEIQQIFFDSVVEGEHGDVRTLAWPDGDAIAVAPFQGGTFLTITRRTRGATADGAASAPTAAAGGAPAGSAVGTFDEIDEGWNQFAQQLRYVVERNPQGRRRTVSAIDLDAGPRGAGPVYRLGVSLTDDVPIGGEWEFRRTIEGEEYVEGGTVWYRSEHQRGFVVTSPAREGLLVVQTTPVAVRPPHGRVSLVLSTYGLDDDEFARVERRWRRWWGL
ncbi:hypothetical protein [Cellulomonas fimi]|uniref:Activator of Hsp90 ATPase 1 family protein n=1 Tax=Cellulomonas fimi TaxID=1708 RepID=A0A7Y0LY88_CELFI|nr:hypothetical protein [Cellulomonas fimi]NMR20074.1 hypothetical protein [Cellulomonas fimi]